ncbi:tetratricopeptide repeat protein [Paenibacillus sp. LHD-38]|uniref:tetratricopeptide repeat protein n=1 Tax=Paenibacillus sp. LHD-38 TaxID=3072143 RepID=UPI00280FCE9E|nr:tetratricopeptide repeat protein [Paenibacillus sp. LHD-38]MDQ8738634.1 tetratricopeptide repeat protein [Paenibacillus sp. LHD-38]
MAFQLSAIVMVEDQKDMEACPLFIRQCEAIADEIIIVSLIPSQYSQEEVELWGVAWVDCVGLRKSEALNKGMDQAQGFWILSLYATEMLLEQEVYRLQMLANCFEEEGFYFPITDRSETKYTVPFETRLFRKRPEYRYQGHSVCCLPLELESKAKLVSFPLFQAGEQKYQSTDTAIDQGDQLYDANLWLADSMERLHLSVKLANCGLLTEAQRLWEEIRMDEGLPLRYGLLLYQWIAQALEENGRYKEALDCINDCLKSDPHDAGLHLIKGQLLFLLDEWDAAEELLHHYLQAGSLSDHYRSEPTAVRCKAWYSLGMISEAKGQLDQAIAYYAKSYEADRNMTAPLYAAARLIHDRDGEKQLLMRLDQWIYAPNGQQQLLLRANILFAERLYKEAKDAAEIAWRSSITHKDAAMMVIADSLLMMGKPNDAILSFMKISEQSPFYVSAMLRTCLTYWILSDWHKARECLKSLRNRSTYSDSPCAAIYMAIHPFLSGEQAVAVEIGEQAFIKIKEEFNYIIRCFLHLKRNDLMESLLPFFENNSYMYPAAAEWLYEYGQFSYADRFAFKALVHDPENEKMGLLFLQSKKEQKRDFEAAQWLSLHLGETMTSPERYMQYVDILWDWTLTIISMGIRDYPQDESLKRYYQAAKELQSG